MKLSDKSFFCLIHWSTTSTCLVRLRPSIGWSERVAHDRDTPEQDNIDERVDELRTAFNQTRQSSIDEELFDVTQVLKR